MEFDKEKYKKWNWKYPYMLHWVLNPGIAVNELILGQRMPKEVWVEKNSSLRLPEKSYIPCPHCGTLHPNLKWSSVNKTSHGNWFGLYCDHCGKIIPCLMNLFTWVILFLTFPLWYYFKDAWQKKWLEKQKLKFSKPLKLELPKVTWWKSGLFYGTFMYFFSTFVIPTMTGIKITQFNILINIPIWIIGGAIFGLGLQYSLRKKKPSQI